MIIMRKYKKLNCEIKNIYNRFVTNRSAVHFVRIYINLDAISNRIFIRATRLGKLDFPPHRSGENFILRN